MLTIKNWVRKKSAIFPAALVLISGCGPPGPRALIAGKDLIEQGNYPEAVHKLELATALLSTNAPPRDQAQAWNYLGLAHQYAGQAEAAAKAYQRAVSLDRDLAEARYNLGCLRLEENKLDAARAEFTAYTLCRDHSANGFNKLGAVHLRAAEAATSQGRARELSAAETNFKEALKITPQNTEALNGLGMVRIARNEPAEAASFFKEALKQDPNYPPAVLNLAIVSERYLHDPATALQKYQQYLGLNPAPSMAEPVRALVHQLEQELKPGRSGALSAPVNATPGGSGSEAHHVATVVQPTGATSEEMRPNKTPANSPAPQGHTPPAAAPAPTARANPSEGADTAITAPASQKDEAARSSGQAARAPGAASTSTNAAPAQAAKRGLLQRMNPLRLFSGSDKAAATTPAAHPGPLTEDISCPLPAAGAGARYAYRSPGKVPVGSRAEAQPFFAEGLAAQKEGHLSDAIRAYQAAVRSDPSFFEAQYNLGLAAGAGNYLRTALAAYENALALKSNSLDTRYNFALTLQRANYPVDAANELERLLAASPKETRAHLVLGNLYAQQLAQPAKARQHYLKVLELDPHNAQAGTIRFWLNDTRL